LKKIATIAILAILLFNSLGYRLLTQYLQHRADTQLQARIDERRYNPASLLELSVDLSLPYTTDQQQWQQYEGSIVIDGIHYRYVERKIENGRLYVRCLPNTGKQQVLSARDEFFKLAYNLGQPVEQKKSAPVFVSNYLGDYDDATQRWQLSSPLVAAAHPAVLAAVACRLRPAEVPDLPPECWS
jgi:hypothetical protein